MRKAFRKTCCLAFLPNHLVRRGFNLIINAERSERMRVYFYCFAMLFVGLTQFEKELKENAFIPYNLLRGIKYLVI